MNGAMILLVVILGVTGVYFALKFMPKAQTKKTEAELRAEADRLTKFYMDEAKKPEDLPPWAADGWPSLDTFYDMAKSYEIHKGPSLEIWNPRSNKTTDWGGDHIRDINKEDVFFMVNKNAYPPNRANWEKNSNRTPALKAMISDSYANYFLTHK